MFFFHFFFRIAFTLRGLPAGCPIFFFWAILVRFSLSEISPDVAGVFELTRFDGLQYGVPRSSPFCRPQAFPERTSFQSSLNHLRSAAPFAVFLTAIHFFFFALLPQLLAPTLRHFAIAPEA
jgi:hypothetical protein